MVVRIGIGVERKLSLLLAGGFVFMRARRANRSERKVDSPSDVFVVPYLTDRKVNNRTATVTSRVNRPYLFGLKIEMR